MIPRGHEIAVAIFSAPALSLIVKATVVAAVAVVMTRLARRRRASIRHLICGTALIVLLVLPLAVAVVPERPVAMPILDPDSITAAMPSALVLDVPAAVAPAADAGAAAAPRQPRVTLSPPVGALTAWIGGTALVLAPMLWGLVRIRRVRRNGVPWPDGERLVASFASALGIRRHIEVLLDDAADGPMTCGVVHPAIIFPRTARQWVVDDLRRAVVHEMEHVKRADWLTLCLARSVCAIYWFHPLVWMLWRQLRLEAERACDDAVLRSADPETYAEQLVTLAERLVSSRTHSALAMANRDDLSARVSAVLDGRQSRGRAGSLWIAGAAVAATVLISAIAPLRAVAVVGMAQQPVSTLRFDMAKPSPRSPGDGRSQVPSSPMLDRAMAISDARSVNNQDAAGPPQFDVASVKPCAPSIGGRSGPRPLTPGILNPGCNTVVQLIQLAYGRSNSLEPIDSPLPVAGGPAWIRTDRYEVIAKARSTSSISVMRGPMLRALLAERFRLKLHTESRDVPVYLLTIAPGGPTMRFLDPDSCQPRPQLDGTVTPIPRAVPENPWCGNGGINGNPNSGRLTAHSETMPFPEFAAMLGTLLDRPLIDKTGINRIAAFSFQFAVDHAIVGPGGLPLRAMGPVVDSGAPGVVIPAVTVPSIFTAIREIGLRLEAARGPQDHVVVDSAERPTEN